MKAASRKGFTLIEILIVVIILGILAAIVIPQFTSASEDAKQSSVASMIQSARGQIELYKLNHGDSYPTLTGAGSWLQLTSQTAFGGQTYGPYMQSAPVNPFNQNAAVGTAASGTSTGWALVSTNGGYKFFGLGKGGTWIGD